MVVLNYSYGSSSRLPPQANLIQPRPDNTSPAVQEILSGVATPSNLSSLSGGNVNTNQMPITRPDNTSLPKHHLAHHLGKVAGSDRCDNHPVHLLSGGVHHQKQLKGGDALGDVANVAKTIGSILPFIL